MANGLTYFILPNNNPPGRFEAHLEVLSGSANELETQQGMAHLIEHVAYMGSPKVLMAILHNSYSKFLFTFLQ